VKRRLLLDVVVGECSAVLELLAREDQPLLVRRDALPAYVRKALLRQEPNSLVLNLRLDVVNGVGRFDLQSDSLASQPETSASDQIIATINSRLHKDLHTTTQPQDEV
jgi:hypothetical protein